MSYKVMVPLRTLQLCKAIHGHSRRPSDELQQPTSHFIIKVLHDLPEPDNDIIRRGVASTVVCVFSPVINIYLCESTEKVFYLLLVECIEHLDWKYIIEALGDKENEVIYTHTHTHIVVVRPWESGMRCMVECHFPTV